MSGLFEKYDKAIEQLERAAVAESKPDAKKRHPKPKQQALFFDEGETTGQPDLFAPKKRNR